MCVACQCACARRACMCWRLVRVLSAGIGTTGAGGKVGPAQPSCSSGGCSNVVRPKPTIYQQGSSAFPLWVGFDARQLRNSIAGLLRLDSIPNIHR